VAEPLEDPTILQWIETALREERTCRGYVRWEEDAEKELVRDAQLKAKAVNGALDDAFVNGVWPTIEIQKGGPYDGEPRYVWRIKVDETELYVKTNVKLDHLKEPLVIVVRCHTGWY